MRMIYVANVRLPTERAHGLQIVKMCEAFAARGADLTLLVPQRTNRLENDPFRYYGVARNFTVRYLPVLNPSIAGGPIGYWLQELSFALAAQRAMLQMGDAAVFSRSMIAAFMLSFGKRAVFYELHDFPRHAHVLWRMALRRMTGIISTNRWKAAQVAARGVPESRILVAPNGFDPHLFDIRESKEALRSIFDLPRDRQIAVYTGHLYGWKGADVLLEAARNFQSAIGVGDKFPLFNFQTNSAGASSLFQKDILFVFVGGTPQDAEHFRVKARGLQNVLIVGHRHAAEIPRWLKAADILVLPNSAKTEESQYATSPLKLFEYMASGRPIVASDLPSIREIVSEREAFFFTPDSAVSLAERIMELLSHAVDATRRAAAAEQLSERYTLPQRAEAILHFIRAHREFSKERDFEKESRAPRALRRTMVWMFDIKKRRDMESFYRSRKDPWGRGENAPQVEAARTLTGDRVYQRCLDVGTGEGYFAYAFRNQCKEITAIDIAESALAAAQRRLAGFPHVTLRRENIRTWSSSSTFDLVMLGEVLFYLGDQFARDEFDRLLAKLVAMTERGGNILITHFVAPYRDREWFEKRYVAAFQKHGMRVVRRDEFRLGKKLWLHALLERPR